jgi:signal peptidase I
MMAATLTPAFAGELLRREGHLWCRVATTSMAPILRPEDRVLVAPLNDAPVHRGDLLAIVTDESLLVHRLVRRTTRGLVLKGDALTFLDPPVTDSFVLGRVLKIARGDRERSLTTLGWRFLNRLLADYSRGLARLAPDPSWRLMWALLRLPHYVVAWTVWRVRW